MKILVTYATVSGNTQKVAEAIAEALDDHEVTLKNMEELTPEELNQYQHIFFGSSTMEDGDYNLTSHDFFESLSSTDIDLSGVQVSVFALGDSTYPHFATVAEKMEAELKSKKASLIGESIKIDGYPDQNKLEDTCEWAGAIVE